MSEDLNSGLVTLRRAVRTDGAELIQLICALAEFEHLPAPDAKAQERLLEHGFGDRPRFETWLAFIGEAAGPIGYALFFETYSTFEARPSLYLEDLFVLPAYRGRGAGSALMRHCIGLAHERGCGRMEWICLDWNTKAQVIYEALGAHRKSEWIIYRLPREKMTP